MTKVYYSSITKIVSRIDYSGLTSEGNEGNMVKPK